ncbi:MAG: DUF6572 domain-containing protein [Silvibacterium sp.]
MSVEDSKTVDIVSLKSKPGTALLIVSDQLDWLNTLEHQVTLQEKFNAYLSFIESGELFDRFPEAEGKQVEIRVVFKFAPDSSGEQFLRRARDVVEHAGFRLSYQIGVEAAPTHQVN